MGKTGGVEEGCISIGPWGGLKGESWAYKANHARITHLTVCHGMVINFISFQAESCCDGTFTLQTSDKFGGSGGHRTDKILSSMNLFVQRDPGPSGAQRGRQWDDGVFQAIKQVIVRMERNYLAETRYKPMIQGIQFEYEQRDGKSFTSPWHGSNPFGQLHKVKTSSVDEGCISIGPWGGLEGEPWSYKADGRITQIIVRHGWAVDSILFKSQSCGCLSPECSEKFGGDGGRTDTIFIDNVVEHLTTISLTWGEFEGQSAIRSLCFHTNLTEYGPFGLKEGTNSVTIPIKGGVIVGFHGRAGRLLNAIGFYVAQKIPSFCPIQDSDSVPTHIDQIWFCREIQGLGVPLVESIGMTVFSRPLRKVYVNVVDAAHSEISSILEVRFVYDKGDGKCFQSPWHGSYGTSGIRTEMIELDLDCSEVIVGIEGFHGPLIERKNGFEALTSITLYTNKRKYGPYGREIGTHFSSMHGGGEVVGFFGRSGTHLIAIGVHMKYF